MTVAEQQREQHQQQQRPQSDPRAAANRDAAREHGNHIATIADIAEAQFAESEQEREDRNRYEDGLQVLRWLVTAPWSERILEIDRVLHDEHGSLSSAKVSEYIGLLIGGMSSLDARYAMAAAQPRRAARAQATRDAVAAARLVSANLHRMAEAPPAQPALPPAPSVAPSNGAQLPQRVPGAPARREAIAPALPPMVPPAPPESPAEQTGQIIAALRGNGYLISSDMEAAARKDGKSGLAVAPPDPAYAVTAIPAQRHLSDTVEFRADQVLASLAADDASQEMVADGPVERAGERVEPLPFAEAAVSAAPGSRPESASEASDD